MKDFAHRRYCRILIVTAFVFLAAKESALAAPETFVVDTVRSTVAFQVRHLATNVNGTFSRFKGSFTIDRDRPETNSASFTIEVASLVTDDGRRTARLARDDFFATARFPTMQFTSTSWKEARAETYEITGHLTLKGTTQPVVVHVQAPNATSDRWEAIAKLDRRSFGVTGGPPGLIGNEVDVRISLEARRVHVPSATLSAAAVHMVSSDEPGERLTLHGTVYGADGVTPVPGAKLYVFHTDASGVYSPTDSGVGDERNPRLRCRLTTDEQGRFEIRTLVPGPYPGGKTPRHIHLIVTSPDGVEHNATFSFADDPNLTPDDYQRHGRDGFFSSIRPIERRPDGTLHCRRDIKLRSAR